MVLCFFIFFSKILQKREVDFFLWEKRFVLAVMQKNAVKA